MRWWWAGVYRAFRKKLLRDRAAKPSRQSVVLVVGSTGTVGASLPLEDTPGEPFEAYAISCHALPPSPAALPPGFFHGRFDLADPEHVALALEPLTDYAASDPQYTDAAAGEPNRAILRDTLSVLLPNCPKLTKVCLQTSRKRLLGPFEPLCSTRLPELLVLGDGLEGAIIKEILPHDEFAYWSFVDAMFDMETVRTLLVARGYLQ
jgi:hypothetical protein